MSDNSLISIKRLLYVFVPRFAATFSGLTSAQHPQALIEQQRQVMLIHSCNSLAESMGVRPGMALSDARAFAKQLKTAEKSPAQINRGLERLTRWLSRYSPLVGHSDSHGDCPQQIGGGAGFWIDISGVAHLLGGEQALMADLEHRLSRLGLTDARLAIAPTAGMAWALAHYTANTTNTTKEPLTDPSSAPKSNKRRHYPSVDQHDLRSALLPLPPAALRLDEATLEALDRLGLRQISDILALPRQELGQRFPKHRDSLLRRIDQALGQSAESIEPLFAPSAYACRQLYPEPVQHKQAVLEGLKRGLEVVIPMLERDQRGVRQLDLRLFRVDGLTDCVQVRTNAPSRHVGDLCRLFDDKLDQLDVGFGLDALVVDVPRHDPMAWSQTSLLSRTDKRTKGAVFDRITNRFGPNSVRRLVPSPSHSPGQDALAVNFAQAQALNDPWRQSVRDRMLVGLDQDAPAGDQGRQAVRRGKLLEPARHQSKAQDSPPLALTMAAEKTETQTNTTAATAAAAATEKPEAAALSPALSGLTTAQVDDQSYAPADEQPDRLVPRRPLHLLPRPAPVDFRSEAPSSNPTQTTGHWRMIWRRVEHNLVELSGPERITADWWKAHIATDAFERCPKDYYQARDREGRGYYLFELLDEAHQPTKQWYMAGVFG